MVLLLPPALLPQRWRNTSPDSVHSVAGAFAPLHSLCGQVGPWHYFSALPKAHPPYLMFGNRIPVMPRSLGAPVSKEELALGILVLCQVGFTLKTAFVGGWLVCLPSICPPPDLGVRRWRWHLILVDAPPWL